MEATREKKAVSGFLGTTSSQVANFIARGLVNLAIELGQDFDRMDDPAEALKAASMILTCAASFYSKDQT